MQYQSLDAVNNEGTNMINVAIQPCPFGNSLPLAESFQYRKHNYKKNNEFIIICVIFVEIPGFFRTHSLFNLILFVRDLSIWCFFGSLFFHIFALLVLLFDCVRPYMEHGAVI